VAPAMEATINLTCQFFGVSLAYWLASTLFEVFQVKMCQKWKQIFDLAKQTVLFAPMLSVLFIGTRMRALQIDPTATHVPQPWAQQCFIACMYAVLVQCILVVLVGAFGTVVPDKEAEGEFKFEFGESKLPAQVLNALQAVAMLAMYGGAGAIIYANFEMHHPDHPNNTPPLAPAMQNVMILVVQFFIIKIGVYVGNTLRNLVGLNLGSLIQTLKDCDKTVAFAPMLSVLFLATRMRAEEIAGSKGMPQGWVIEAMFLATFSLAIKMTLILIQGALEKAPKVIKFLVTLLEQATQFGLYAGILIVMFGIAAMEPTVLNGKGGRVFYVLFLQRA